MEMHLTLSRPTRAGSLKSMTRTVLGAFFARKSRRALAELDDNLLRDIGLTREDAQSEAAKPIWNVPCHWVN